MSGGPINPTAPRHKSGGRHKPPSHDYRPTNLRRRPEPPRCTDCGLELRPSEGDICDLCYADEAIFG